LGFPFNIITLAEANDFKFGTLLGFAKTHHKITPRRLGKHPNIRVPLLYFCNGLAVLLALAELSIDLGHVIWWNSFG